MTVPDTIAERRQRHTDDLRRCEAVIERGLGTFLEVGLALREIKVNELYRRADGAAYRTFDDYCRARWKMSARQANREILAARTAKLITAGDEAAVMTGPIGPAPKSESQARELGKLRDDPAAVRRVWSDAVGAADGGQPTAQQVKQARQRYEEERRRTAGGATLPEAGVAPPAGSQDVARLGPAGEAAAPVREAAPVAVPASVTEAGEPEVMHVSAAAAVIEGQVSEPAEGGQAAVRPGVLLRLATAAGMSTERAEAGLAARQLRSAVALAESASTPKALLDSLGGMSVPELKAAAEAVTMLGRKLMLAVAVAEAAQDGAR